MSLIRISRGIPKFNIQIERIFRKQIRGIVMEQFTKLGTAAVLDADKLVVGSYVEMEDQLFVVSKIVNDKHVYFRLPTGTERLLYLWSQLSFIGKTLICGTIFFVAIILYRIL